MFASRRLAFLAVSGGWVYACLRLVSSPYVSVGLIAVSGRVDRGIGGAVIAVSG